MKVDEVKERCAIARLRQKVHIWTVSVLILGKCLSSVTLYCKCMVLLCTLWCSTYLRFHQKYCQLFFVVFLNMCVCLFVFCIDVFVYCTGVFVYLVSLTIICHSHRAPTPSLPFPIQLHGSGGRES